MAKREMVVSGYTGTDAEGQVEPFLRDLLGQFTDTMSEADKMLLEYTAVAGLPDLYYATYDTEAFTLTNMEGTDAPGVFVSFGHEPRNPGEWRRLRYAFNQTLSLAMEID